MTIDEKMVLAIKEIINDLGNNHIMTTSELKRIISKKIDTNQSSIIPSDYCYNIVNKGININNKPLLFIQEKRGYYRCVGENFDYNGPVKSKGLLWGKCINGVRIKQN